MPNTFARWLPWMVALALACAGDLRAQWPSDPMFEAVAPRTIRITMSPGDWQMIVDHPERDDVYRCTFDWNGEALTNVGVKTKGQSSPTPGNPKPSLRFRFNHYLTQAFRGLTRLDAGGLGTDDTMLRERLVYDACRRFGLPAPRTNYVRLEVNGQYKGVYLIYDYYDQAEALRMLFPDHRGNLYKVTWTQGGWRPDATVWVGEDPALYVTPQGPYDWKRQQTPAADDLVALLRVANLSDDAQLQTLLPSRLDMDEFLGYCAVNEVVANEDWMFSDVLEWTTPVTRGSPSANNTWFYHEPQSGRFHLLIWDVNATMDDVYTPETWVARDLFLGLDRHVLSRRVMGVPAWRARYLERVRQLVEAAFSAEAVVADLDVTRARIDSAIQEDPVVSYDAWRAAGDRLRAQVPQRVQNVRGQLGLPESPEREVTAGLGEGGQDHLYTWRTNTTNPPAPQLYQLAWAPYDAAVGETRPAYGDVDGDGLDELVIGFGRFPSNGGWVQIRDDAEHGHALLGWVRVPDATYNAANGETFPACGDTDMDGRAEIAVGLGRGGRGRWYVFDDAVGNFALLASRQVPWPEYNDGPGGGETRLALGDIDLDGRAEPVIGLGPGGQGRWCTFSDAFSDYQFRTWNQVDWPDYDANRAGTTRPAVGDIDADGLAEVIIGLEQGGECRLEVFDDAWHGHAHMEWVQVGEEPYRSAVGATRPSLGDMDGDGDADLAVGFGRGGQGSVEVWRRSTSQGRYVPWWTRQVPGPGGYASANGETWPAFGNRRWSR